jgi:uncharacterized delta-60 repeat protein
MGTRLPWATPRRLLVGGAALAGLAATAALAALVAPPPASALVAPGRVTVPFMSGARAGIDPFSVAGVAVMPDGRIVTSGIDARAHRLLLTRVTSTGRPDPAFGGGDGIVSVAVPYELSTYGPFPSGPQLAPDGSVYLVNRGPAAGKLEGGEAIITHVLRDGALDPGFGAGGVAMSGVQEGAFALTGDGRILVAGQVGQYNLTNLTQLPNISAMMTVEVVRLSATGAMDPTFGNGGRVTVAGNATGAIVSLPNGGLALTTSQGDTSRLIELAADGSPVPAFNHGGPLIVSGFPDGLLPRPDGAVDVLTTNRDRTAAALVRVRPDGTGDPSFGTGGAVSVPDGTLIPGLDGSDLITGIGAIQPPPGKPFTVTIHRILADGTSDRMFGGLAGRSFALAFGGGFGTLGAVHAQPVVASLDQTGFQGGAVAVRPDGGFVVAGAVAAIRYTGEGDGVEHEDVGLAAFAGDLTPDVSFGGPAVAPTVTVSLPRQRASTAAAPRRRYVLVRLATSPGLCQISVRGRGTVVAKADVPVFSPAGQNAHVWLTSSGRRLLSGARSVAVTARATCRDLVGTAATAPAVGLLR